MFRLDYVSCVLTIASTILVGRKCWQGWALGAVNSVIVCVIGVKTEQFGFIPANMFYLVLCGVNIHNWRKAQPVGEPAQAATEQLEKAPPGLVQAGSSSLLNVRP